jgi:hypothetical protein
VKVATCFGDSVYCAEVSIWLAAVSIYNVAKHNIITVVLCNIMSLCLLQFSLSFFFFLFEHSASKIESVF